MTIDPKLKDAIIQALADKDIEATTFTEDCDVIVVGTRDKEGIEDFIRFRRRINVPEHPVLTLQTHEEMAKQLMYERGVDRHNIDLARPVAKKQRKIISQRERQAARRERNRHKRKLRKMK